MLNRREMMTVMPAIAAASLAKPVKAAVEVSADKTTGLGLVVYCCRLRRQHLLKARPPVDLNDPATMLEHCRRLGAGGMQINLGILERDAAAELRQAAERLSMYIEAIVSVPREKRDVDRFQAQMQTAAAVGACAVRTTIMPGRRYEFFDTMDKFREFEARGRNALELAAPIAEKVRVPLAVENHKDHRNLERVELFKQISSEYVGACVDTGNSFSLLEDPIETVTLLAPWARSVHLKDQAVQPYVDGFLLGDIPLGQGFLDLKKMVTILKKSNPRIRFSLELITRDPLKVPCLTKRYWATFPDIRGDELARTLRTVRDGSSDTLQYISTLSPEEQLAVEDANVRSSLDYARDELHL